MGEKTHKKALKRMEIRDRRRQVSALYMRGWTQFEIAKSLSLSPTTVYSDLKAVRKEWLNKAINNYQARQAEELAKLDNLEKECWKQYHALMGKEKVTEIKRLLPSGDGGPSVMTTVERRVETQPPWERYLDKIITIIERRCRLLGINEPDRLDIGGDLAAALRELADREKAYTEQQEKGEMENDNSHGNEGNQNA